jgi:hypothetical protein
MPIYSQEDMKRYAYGWLTVLFFVVSIGGHWIFGWYAFLQDAAEHAQQPVFSEYAIQMGRDTLENWQSNSCSCCGRWSASRTSCTWAHLRRRKMTIGSKPRSTSCCA